MDSADWRSGGHTVGSEEYYEGHGQEDEIDDHGGWNGGEFVLGASSAGGAESVGQVSSQGMS